MTTTELRTKVHQYVDEANGDTLEVIVQLLERHRQSSSTSRLSQTEQKEVLHRSDMYKQGKTKVYTLSEAKERLKKISG